MVKVIEKSDRRFADLKEFVTKYDPKRIGVNCSERLAFADGITHEDYTLLSDAIGPQFEKRILSADMLIVDFLSGKVTSELRIPLNHTFTLEYMVHMPVPEWSRGKHILSPLPRFWGCHRTWRRIPLSPH